MRSIPFHDLKRMHVSSAAALKAAFGAVVDSGWYVLGERLQRFEQAFAAYCGVRSCVGVGNGTDALELALRAVGVGGGDRVITVANAGFYASAAILQCAAEPLYIDIDPDTLLMEPRLLEPLLACAPRAIIVTHLYGQLAPIERVAERCRAAGVAVIEDCAQAHGAHRDGKMAGSFGAIGCYSFYPTKNLGALGDAGGVVTDDALLADRVRALRQYGWQEKYRVAMPNGKNSRLDELQAAALLALLPRLDADNERRRDIASQYFHGIRNSAISAPRRHGSDDVVHLYPVRCTQRDALRRHLADSGIATEVHYPIADHRQSIMPQVEPDTALPNTDQAVEQLLSLPCHPALSDEEVSRVIDACCQFNG